MSDLKIIQGEIFRDHRGQISSINDLRFDGIERTYFIHHPDTSIVRGWHGHQFEKKWFYCVKGAFTLGFVRPDDWVNPSPDLVAEIIRLDESDSRVVVVPEGYANCIKASVPGSVLLVFSGKLFEDALGDSWRYDSSMWVDWSKY